MAAVFRNSLGLLLLGALACARTSLRPGSDDAANDGGAPAEAGKGGSLASTSGGKHATGGGVAESGSASGGYAMAGAPSVGGTSAGAGAANEAGSAGEPAMACDGEPVSLVSVTPRNAAVNAPRDGLVGARFACIYDRALATSQQAHLTSEASGAVPSSFPEPKSDDELWLEPRPFFAGDTVTGFLGPELGGPYLWRFTVATSPASPGKFASGKQALSGLPPKWGMKSGDVDGDGDIDVVIGRPKRLVLLSNQGDGTFADAVELPGEGYPALVLGDVDRDGDLDIAAGERLLFNDGTGQFPTSTAAKGCAALGDVDGDADLDCIANTGYQAGEVFGQVLLYDQGTFVPGPEAPFGFDCPLADFDADGDLDVTCVSPVVEAARVFANDGHGVFTQTQNKMGETGARGIAVGDLDLDGDVDIVITHWHGGGKSAPNEIWLNDGHGKFEQKGTIGSNGIEMKLGDVDGDGDLDAVDSVAGPYPSGSGGFNRAAVYVNDGAGHFSKTSELGEPAFHWLELADFDGDHDLDAFVYNQLGDDKSFYALWLNQE